MSSNLLARLAGDVLNRPLLLEPTKAQVLTSVLGGRIGLDAPSVEDLQKTIGPQADRFFGSTGSEYQKSAYEVIDRKAVITISGALVNRGAYLNASSGLVSYEGIGALMRTAMVDDEVDGVLLDLNSPGGDAVGAFETTSLIRKLSEQKPIIAHVNGMAASAGYALACGCQEIISIPSGISGSIGVVVVHLNEADKDKMEGREFTFIHAGANKVDGHRHAPLSDAAKAGFQESVDDFYQRFVSSVADARGLNEDAVRGTEARTFTGDKAVELGLVDATGTFEEALECLSSHISSRSGISKGKMKMSKTGGPLAQSDDDARTLSTAELEALKTEAHAEGVKAGVEQERERGSAILALEEAKGRETMAMAAIQTGLSVEAAKAMLAVAPLALAPKTEEGTGAGPAQFAKHKQELEANTPDVQPGAGGSSEEDKGANLLAFAGQMYGKKS
ncbi:S49 family peptidase [Pseudovibrio sp. Tun.PSC04-5.I4]|uniref:S49 family peptidase n=1 Tax=Pseudovibrio sp. Tun.PSC04-5.I4 TaxID=1798213 RepID=UPI000885F055|nr:S49 family peptidase [Pseudovibrio sp. Tun.PSC04-5.I4]SDQ99595.1 signal peptide peptidase SppA [Pseudovibrio sp. Tun.PSC04-5.I4]